jgi:hypothetical protein
VGWAIARGNGYAWIALPIHAQDSLNRIALLVCDGCGGVMSHDGATTAKPYRESMPEDLAPHYDARGVLQSIARDSGWTADDGERTWQCSHCSNPPPPPAT